MAALRLPGLATGIDTAALIAQLMEVQRRTLNTWETRKEVWEERQGALTTLEGKLSNLRNSVRALSDADELRAFNVSSSDTDYLTAEATSSAFEGNHTVVINRLANAERWVHTAGKEYAEDYVGAGTFIYSYNHKETSITTTSTTTLEDLVGLINNDANNPGVTASLLYFNDVYHLVLNGNEAGTDYEISINASSTEVWQPKSEFKFTQSGSDNATLSTKITDLDQFSGTLEGGEVIEITGTDHDGVAIAQVDLPITENTRLEHLIGEINDAFDGTAKAVLENGKIVLTDDTYGTSDLEIILTYNPNGSSATLTLPDEAIDWDETAGGLITANLIGFAEADFTESQSAQDSEIRVDGYPIPQAGIAEVQTLEATTLPSDGTYTLTYDGQTTAPLDHDYRAVDVQNALEALSNVNPGDIEVTGERLDQTGPMIFTFLDTVGDVNMISINSGNLTPSDPSKYVFTEQTKGENYGWIKRSSNTIDDVIAGVTLHLHDTTDANGEEITLTRDIQSVKDKLDSMIIAYNAAIEHVKETTGYNEITEVAGILIGDYVVSTMRYKFRAPLIEQTPGFIEDIDTFLTPVHIGLELDRNGVLSLDTNAFDEAIAEDYMGVLALIGADKTGSSTSNEIEFYGADDYTTAGEYDVQVEFDGSGNTTAVRIKLSTESSYRNMDYSSGVATGISTFDDNGDPNYAECGLQITVPTTGTPSSTISATVRVKQGFAGKIEDAIDRMLKVTVGSIVIGQEHVQNQIELLQDKIEDEEYRLVQREKRLILRFARLEKTLALIQHQLAAAGIISLPS